MMQAFADHISNDCSSAFGSIDSAHKKPGRGDATLSMSCFDKITRWNVVGVQGSHILYNIIFDYIEYNIIFDCLLLNLGPMFRLVLFPFLWLCICFSR